MSAPWYVDFFQSGDYARIYSFDEEQSEKEAGFAARALGLNDGQRVLDLCCGTGRHLRPLNALGIDLNRDAVRGLRAACADMRELPLRSSSFDAAVSLFSSFGYLESDAEDLRVLREVSRVLRPGGKLLLDLLNREYALCGFADTVQKLHGETLVVEKRAWDAFEGRLSTAFVIISEDGVRTESAGHCLRLYSLTELRALIDAAGLAIERVYGGVGGEPYNLESVRMITVISKRSW